LKFFKTESYSVEFLLFLAMPEISFITKHWLMVLLPLGFTGLICLRRQWKFFWCNVVFPWLSQCWQHGRRHRNIRTQVNPTFSKKSKMLWISISHLWRFANM